MAARWFVLVVLVSFAMFLTVVRADADALPVRRQVGDEFAGSVLPSGPVAPADTRVRMISETVTVAIANSVYADIIRWSNVDENCQKAHVEATFLMRNLSDNDEHIYVAFPAPKRTYETFRAWVNGVLVFSNSKTEQSYESWPTVVARTPSRGTLPVHTTRTASAIEPIIEITGEEIWAVWPASFPAHKDVVIRVDYDLEGMYGSYGNYAYYFQTYHYILGTGRYWAGDIGFGKIVFRLPFLPNAENCDLSGLSTIERYGQKCTVVGRDVICEFRNVEPAEGDRISVQVVHPGLWWRLEAARAAATREPTSASAALNLAIALATARPIDFPEEERVFGHVKLDDETTQAYWRAIALAPDDLSPYLAYGEWLLQHELGLHYTHAVCCPPPEELWRIARAAEALSPEDPRVRSLMAEVRRWQDDYNALPTLGPEDVRFIQTQAAEMTLAASFSPTPLRPSPTGRTTTPPTASTTPTATIAQRAASLTASPQSSPPPRPQTATRAAATPTAAATATPTAKAQPLARASGRLVGVIAAAVALLAITLAFRLRVRRASQT